MQVSYIREESFAYPESTNLDTLKILATRSLASPVGVPVSIREIYRLEQFCDKHDIGLIVIGPEDPLAEGYADKLAKPGRLVFGPGRDGAQIESDKAWAKSLMRHASIPTAEARAFTDHAAAAAYVQSRDEAPVVKAAGLAKGKGVFVPATKDEALAALKRIMIDKEFGDAGRTVVLEERLKGVEASVLALTDGASIAVLPPCQDHKRLGDGDTGPNTGGMGVFCPTTTIDAKTMARIERDVLVPAVDALKREGISFRGVLYAGLMLTPAGPKVLEFNCRFGDPECEPLMARLKSDLLEVLLATCEGRLSEIDLDWDERAACCVVLAAPGYPDKPRTGIVIEGVEEAEKVPGVVVDHAGTRRDAQGRLVTGGGRVLAVTGLGATMEDARRAAYAACDKIRFEGKVLRRDIAATAR